MVDSLQILWLILGTCQALGDVYLPAAANEASGGLKEGRLATEYFEYTAPSEEDTITPWQSARQLAQAISPPQQVVFIRTPETNLFSLTAKQLAANNPLDIFVLQRQADAAVLAQQQVSIEQQVVKQPSVHFVKYRTPADVTRALSSLRSDYDRLPGNSISHAIEKATVFHLNPPQAPVSARQGSTPTPVIFKIRPRDSKEYETHEQASELETAQLQALFREYLPPTKRR
ncbi:hypothetical protein KR018_010436 [Drosophila ironensis]|nr:hypothetical protein KR018_010436 [Drosophila ironensis]